MCKFLKLPIRLAWRAHWACMTITLDGLDALLALLEELEASTKGTSTDSVCTQQPPKGSA